MYNISKKKKQDLIDIFTQKFGEISEELVNEVSNTIAKKEQEKEFPLIAISYKANQLLEMIYRLFFNTSDPKSKIFC